MTNEYNRCLSCAKPSCKSACPVNNDIPQFLRLVKQGDYAAAVGIIGHPFGEICGYVCPHDKQCQGGCVLNKRGAPVKVGEVERDVFALNPYKVERTSNALDGMKIAVVGGGVCGVTFAVKTYERGADVTVYEGDKLLSTLRLIPPFRLPVDAIERVETALNGKINVVNKTVDGEHLRRLERDYDVVLVSVGASVNYGLGVDGAELAIDCKDCLQGNFTGKNVVIVGGGNSAMDCARLINSRGGRATVAYRRTVNDMPAFAKEIEQAMRENVKFICNVAPVKLERANGCLALLLAKTVSEGRGKLTITDELSTLTCDCVVTAIGSGFDDSVLGGRGKNTENYHQFGNVFLGGDAKRGKLVADAVADGLRIADLITENKGKICSSTK